ncbi:hypothetical protein ACJIZ3_025400 [Penstemon smallii]|uniref:Uncharacterized protein n=1 Tax=Penstemon smallii TaxID=265156 RepID=A0ABD3TUH6_9LAMI
MVRCILEGKMYETRPELVEETETERKLGVGSGGLRCMMNGIIYYPGCKDSTEAWSKREIRAAARASKIIEDCFDYSGRAGLKIVYVDTKWRYEPHKSYKHIETIVEVEKDKEVMEGRRGPRLVIVKQDRDYWPGSEKDDGVMDRRAAKERDFKACKGYGPTPDYRDVEVVNSLTGEEEEERAKIDTFDYIGHLMMTYKRYFDPSLPGAKVVIDNIGIELRGAFGDCMTIPGLRTEWVTSPLGCTILASGDTQYRWLYEAIQNRGYELPRAAKSVLDSGISL